MTGVRGAGSVTVMICHYFLSANSTQATERLLGHGYACVDLFFVLSGFVMIMTYGQDFRHDWQLETYVTFLVRRVGRVYPLYIVIASLGAAAAYAAHHAPSTGTLVANAFLVQTWGFADSIVVPTWSVSTELAAYILFPFLLTVVSSRPAALLAMGLLLALGITLLCSLSNVSLNQQWRLGPYDINGTGTPFPLLRCLAGFVLGLIGFRLLHVSPVKRLAMLPFAGDVAMLATATLFFYRVSDTLLVLSYVPLVLFLAQGRSITGSLLSTRVMHWLGDISYSVYVWHMLLLAVLRPLFQHALEAMHVPHAFSVAAFLMMFVTLGISAASSAFIESPGRKLSRRLSSGLGWPAYLPGQVSKAVLVRQTLVKAPMRPASRKEAL